MKILLQGLEVEILHDRLILGTKDNTVQARMFREAGLTLNRPINMCRIAKISEQYEEDIYFTRKRIIQPRKHSKAVELTMQLKVMEARQRKQTRIAESANIVAEIMSLIKGSVLLMGNHARYVVRATILHQFANSTKHCIELTGKAHPQVSLYFTLIYLLVQ